ncbi:hypothetical protein [Azospirillum picis]|uniref:Uncharacterized protein n=1 Tax=Azospirillum picis TaxID=488438 RepID=A0ABU0MCQ2_9PROT|nr:hypothetical protein [Azospirillum picis]MBP2297772.1 hypothetical protein [Azospirillum picis]MDQ0531205.1 hypothetical protein [Azospirillum picis]
MAHEPAPGSTAKAAAKAATVGVAGNGREDAREPVFHGAAHGAGAGGSILLPDVGSAARSDHRAGADPGDARSSRPDQRRSDQRRSDQR